MYPKNYHITLFSSKNTHFSLNKMNLRHFFEFSKSLQHLFGLLVDGWKGTTGAKLLN